MRMNRKKAKILIIGICAVALVTWIILMVTIFRDPEEKKPEKEPTPMILPEVPEGSVLVWVWTETREMREGEPGETTKEKLKYDEYGRCIEIEYYYSVPSVDIQTKFEYIEGDHRTVMIERTYGSDGKRGGVYTHEYDAEGHEVRLKEEFSDASSQTTARRYDENGILRSLDVTRYSPDGGIYDNSSSRTTYDICGHVSGRMDSTDGANWDTIGVGEYDEQGRIVLYEERDSDGDITLRESYEYQPDGGFTYQKSDHNGLKVCRFNAEGYILSFEQNPPEGSKSEYKGNFFEYFVDEDRITVKVTRASTKGGALSLYYWDVYTPDQRRLEYGAVMDDGSNQILRTYEYDAAGRLVKYVYGDNDMVTEYEYDAYGNLVKESVSYSDDSYSDVVTTYEYTPMVITKEQKEYSEGFYLPEQTPMSNTRAFETRFGAESWIN